MKSFVLIPLILGTLTLFTLPTAQGQHQRTRSLSASTNTETIEVVYQRREAQLQNLLTVYPTLSTSAQQHAATEARNLLFEMFDLAIEDKRQEALQLKTLVNQLENDPDYQGQSAELQRLRTQLDQIETQLEYRASHREEIVSQRLAELF